MSRLGFHRFPSPRRPVHRTLAILAIAGAFPAAGQEDADLDLSPEMPAPLAETRFQPLLTNSPFLRSLNLSDSLILTGIARIGDEIHVSLFERDTNRTHLVSNAANSLGWRLVAVNGDPTDLEKVTAQIAMAGGEVFAVRFDERQLKPGEGRPGAGSGGSSSGSPGGNRPPPRDYREGISGDGFRGPPPPELVEKLSRLSDDQRQRLIREIGEIRDRGQVSSEDRQALFQRMVDRALQERR